MRKPLEQICTEIGVDLRETLVAFAGAGTTLEEVARQLGTDASVVWRWVKHYGIAWPTRGDRNAERAAARRAA